MPAPYITTRTRYCDVRFEEIELLVRELRHLDAACHPDATMLAGILTEAMKGGISAPSLTLKPREEEAVGRALERLVVNSRTFPPDRTAFAKHPPRSTRGRAQDKLVGRPVALAARARDHG
jgi:hypothetical protein